MAACRLGHKPGKYHMPLCHDAAILTERHSPQQTQVQGFKKLFLSHQTVSLYLFDPDPDSDTDLQRHRCWCRDRYRYRDRFLVPEYRSVRIAGHDAAVLPKHGQFVYIQSIKLIQSHPSDTKHHFIRSKFEIRH
jgi:hypothetical protein